MVNRCVTGTLHRCYLSALLAAVYAAAEVTHHRSITGIIAALYSSAAVADAKADSEP
jgi:hypothetical protein